MLGAKRRDASAFHHSFSNDDATVNEPSDVPGRHPAVREAINLRYRLLPYFYTLLWQACADDEPMLRPTFLDHEQDARTFGENDDFLIGRDLLVASVVEPGQRRRSCICRTTAKVGTASTAANGSAAAKR